MTCVTEPLPERVISLAWLGDLMRSKSLLIAIVMSSASLVGCLGGNPGSNQDRIEELEAENSDLEDSIEQSYQEGYDVGYGDAYDASYDGLAQKYYNDGWDDGWSIATEDAQAYASIIEDLNGTIESQLSSISELEGQISSLQSSIIGLDAQIASLQDSIASLEEENATNEEQVSQLNSEVVALEIQKEALEGTISSLEGSISALEDTISSLEAMITSLEAELQSNAIFMEGLNRTILDLQESAIECGEHTSLSDGSCTSDSVVWGRLPFENGTPLTINQAFMGGWTHQEDWLYSVDFAKDEGTPIVSFKEGVVREIKEDSDTNCIDEGISRENCTHGNYVLIDHGDFTFALYLHLEQWSVDVEVGETVGRGHQIGRVGNTGYSTGPHLHFNVKNGFGYGGAKIVLFEELAGISNGIPFSGANVTSNNSNTSATAQVPPSSCPSDAFAFRGVFLLSAVPCSMAEHDVEYNLTGYVASPGMDLQVAQYVQSSAGNYWSYSCIDTSSTGSFSTVLEWDSSVHGEWSYLMISVTPDGDCYAYDSWWTSIGITMF